MCKEKRYRVEKRSGLVLIFDTLHPDYSEDEPGCDVEWKVCSWLGKKVESPTGFHWEVAPSVIEEAEARCAFLNKAWENGK